MFEDIKDYFKDLLVRWFFKITTEKSKTGKWRIIVKAPFLEDTFAIGGEVYPSKQSALRRCQEIYKHGGWLFFVYD